MPSQRPAASSAAQPVTNSAVRLYDSLEAHNDRGTVESTVKRPNHHGDVTIAINCDAFQEEAPAWTTFSDAHSVVMAPVRLLATQSITLAAPRLASAEQPASKVIDMRQLHAASPADSSHRATSTAASAEQPASECHVIRQC